MLKDVKFVIVLLIFNFDWFEFINSIGRDIFNKLL